MRLSKGVSTARAYASTHANKAFSALSHESNRLKLQSARSVTFTSTKYNLSVAHPTPNPFLRCGIRVRASGTRPKTHAPCVKRATISRGSAIRSIEKLFCVTTDAERIRLSRLLLAVARQLAIAQIGPRRETSLRASRRAGLRPGPI